MTLELFYNFGVGLTTIADDPVFANANSSIQYNQGIEVLTGSEGDDTLIIGDGVVIPVIIDLLGGYDTIVLSFQSNPVDVYITELGAINGFNGYVEGILGGFRNVQEIIARAAPGDRLTGMNANATWSIENQTYTVGTRVLDFANFETLRGGNADDTFVFENNATYTGTLVGGGGNNTLDFSDYTTPVLVNLSNNAYNADNTMTGVDHNIAANTATVNGVTTTLDGATFRTVIGGSDDDFLIGSTGNNHLIGNAGDDYIAGIAGTNIIDGGAGDDLLKGGTGDDTYIFCDGWGDDVVNELPGGNDTFDFSCVTVELIFYISSIIVEDIDGNNSLSYMGNLVNNIIGGQNNDTFNFSDGASLDGFIDGNGGTNTFNLSDYTSDVNVNMNNSTSTGVNNFTNIQNFVAGTGNNTFTGYNATNTWNITGGNSGQLDSSANVNNISFSNFQNLVGGTGDDTFVFFNGGSLSNGFNGGGGSNTIDFSNYSDTIDFQLTNPSGDGNGYDGTITRSSVFISNFANMSTIIGSTSDSSITAPNTNNTWIIDGANTGSINDNSLNFFGIGNLQGNEQNDTFIMLPGGSLTNSIFGVGGNNTIDYSAYTNDLFINLQNGVSTNIGTGLSGIDNIIGGSGTNTFIGNTNDNTFVVNGGNNNIDGAGGNNTLSIALSTLGAIFDFINNTVTGPDVGNTNFTNIQNFVGGDGNDTFIFGGSTTVSTIDGGGGNNNTLDFTAYDIGDDTGIVIDLIANTATNVINGILNIQGAIGSDFDDVFIGNTSVRNFFDGRGGQNIAMNILCNFDVIINARIIGLVCPTAPAATPVPPGVFVPLPVVELPQLGAPPVTTIRGFIILVRSYQLVAIQPRIATMLVLDSLTTTLPTLRATEGDFVLITPFDEEFARLRRSIAPVTTRTWLTSVVNAFINPSLSARQDALDTTYRFFSTLSTQITATLQRQMAENVPTLGDRMEFVSGLNLQMFVRGQMLNNVSGIASLTVSFVIPSEYSDRDLAIMYWNEATGMWEEVASTRTNFNDARYTLRSVPTVLRYWDDGGVQDEFRLYGSPDTTLRGGVDILRTTRTTVDTALAPISGRISTVGTRTGTYVLVIKQ